MFFKIMISTCHAKSVAAFDVDYWGSQMWLSIINMAKATRCAGVFP